MIVWKGGYVGGGCGQEIGWKIIVILGMVIMISIISIDVGGKGGKCSGTTSARIAASADDAVDTASLEKDAA